VRKGRVVGADDRLSLKSGLRAQPLLFSLALLCQALRRLALLP